jgi:hydroxymethylpyrimidine kinase/phosphomethylpyrimidine kinase
MRIAMTIAGSDPSAGAGIQADLKTFAALGVYGVSAVTAVTSQNTTGVSDVAVVPPDHVRSQIQQLLQDCVISAVKTGMLATPDIVGVVADTLLGASQSNVVVDPVIVSSSGRTLLLPAGVSVLKRRLLPLATVVTPNRAEAAELTGMAVRSMESAREAARQIASLGPKGVLITGGHMEGPEAVDLLLYEGRFTELAARRSTGGDVHGTGCTLASAIAAGLSLGDDVPTAVHRAKHYVTAAIEHAIAVGRGSRVPDHFGVYTRKV